MSRKPDKISEALKGGHSRPDIKVASIAREDHSASLQPQSDWDPPQRTSQGFPVAAQALHPTSETFRESANGDYKLCSHGH